MRFAFLQPEHDICGAVEKNPEATRVPGKWCRRAKAPAVRAPAVLQAEAVRRETPGRELGTAPGARAKRSAVRALPSTRPTGPPRAGCGPRSDSCPALRHGRDGSVRAPPLSRPTH